MNRIHTFIAIALCLIPFPCLAQKNKGLGGNNLAVATTIRQAESPYEQSRKNCYAVAISMTGPFNDRSLNTLAFPDNDCRVFFDAVNRQFRYKYDIKRFDLLNLESTRRGYQQAFDLLLRVRGESIKEGDLVLLYFSGHGLTLDGKYYFPLSDADVAGRERMLTGAEIATTAERLANRGANVLIFLDTCEAGSIQDEKLNLTGPGRVACFPASSAVTSTQEKLTIGSSPFGGRLKKVLSGEWMGNRADTLTVQALGDALAPTMVGDIRPLYFSPEAGEVVLVDNARRIAEYNGVLDQYQEYIDKGQKAVSQQLFNEALANYESAESLAGNELHKNDVVSLQPDIQKLREQIQQALQSPATSEVWRYLSSVNENNSLLNLSPDEKVRLLMGCGSYYKAGNDPDYAFNFFQRAYDNGDLTDAPFEIYQITESGSVPSYKPLPEVERMKMLKIASKNGSKRADKVLKDDVRKDFIKQLKYMFAGEDLILGIAANTDGNSVMFPYGLRVDGFWGVLHLSADVGFGPCAKKGYGLKSSTETQTVDGIVVSEPGYRATTTTGSEYGYLSYTISPGFSFDVLSVDIGVGQMWRKRVVTDVYVDSVSSPFNTPELADKGYSIVNYRFEERVAETSSHFIMKAGLSAIIPLNLIKWMDFYVGFRYRMCPKDETLNDYEASFGVAFRFGT